MMAQESSVNWERCFFCGQSREQVRKLILGIHGGICVNCARLCASQEPDIINDATADKCRLCGKSAAQAKKLYGGAVGNACAECIDLCMEIIKTDTAAHVTP